MIQGGLTAVRFTDKKTAAEMEAVRMIARIAMNGREPFTGPVELKFCAYMPIPVSWSKAKRAAALAREILPTVKPDGSNIRKLLEDGIQPPPSPKRKKNETDSHFATRRKAWEMIKVIVMDDKQIVRCTDWKLYDASPRVVVEIREIDGARSAT